MHTGWKRSDNCLYCVHRKFQGVYKKKKKKIPKDKFSKVAGCTIQNNKNTMVFLYTNNEQLGVL